MKPHLATILLSVLALCAFQYVPMPFNRGASLIALDSHCSGSSSTSSVTSQACSSNLTVSAGDMITCSATNTGGESSPSGITSVGDSTNGLCNIVLYDPAPQAPGDPAVQAVFCGRRVGVMRQS